MEIETISGINIKGFRKVPVVENKKENNNIITKTIHLIRAYLRFCFDECNLIFIT
jgi:hypothetical protein